VRDEPLSGHRVVEIGAVELLDHSPTGRTFHRYLNPERAMPADAVAVHGLTTGFLADKPLFAAVADEFLAFVGDAPLVAHNAGFDITFLNAELKRTGKPSIAAERVVDTLVLALRSIPAATTRSRTYARAMALIAPAATNTARCSTPSCLPRSTSSWPQHAKRHWSFAYKFPTSHCPRS
jgi:DNA polymerase III epsilon subunit family exonuclease